MLTLPFELRARLAFDGELCGEVCRTFVDSVMNFYRRRLAALGIPGGKSGAVIVVQRVSSDLRLNPHFHTLALDGVFAEGADGELDLHGLCAAEHGFSLHAATTVGANDRAGKEALSQVHPPPAPRPEPRDARRR